MGLLKVMGHGFIADEVQLRTSAKGTKYTAFSIKCKLGTDSLTTQMLDCVLFGSDAEKIVNAGAKKGSYIWFDGHLRLKSFQRKNGELDKALNVMLSDWEFIHSASKPEPKNDEFVYYDETELNGTLLP